MEIVKMSSEAFESLIAQTEFDERNQRILRDLFVEGRTPQEVQQLYGVTKQRVSQLRQQWANAYLKKAPAGDSIVKVEIELPDWLVLAINSKFGPSKEQFFSKLKSVVAK